VPQILIVMVLVALASEALARPKTDVVTVRNRDRLTCEIKQLARGKLQVKTDDMGTVDIKWRRITSLSSAFYFRLETSQGQRLFGSMRLDEGDSLLQVIGVRETVSVPKLQVVGITPIEVGFWSRFDGSLSFGFSFTKASDVAQLTFDWANLYRTERNLVDFKTKTIITARGDEDVARRADVSLAYNRLLLKRWTGSLTGAVQRNDELALRRRLLLSAGTGVNPVHRNSRLWLITVGLAVLSELGTGSSETTESVEGVVSSNFSLYYYESPKTDIATSVVWYPSLTESERHRIDFDLKLRRELIKDVFFDISFYLNYDSNAPSGEGEKKDFGIVTSFGWSY